jgi:hypothetical protein
MKTKTIYVSKDGREFADQEACKEWEKSEELRKFISLTWYGPGSQFERSALEPDGWISKITLALIKEYHIVKREQIGQTSGSSNNNR